jgi:hypothetical protein
MLRFDALPSNIDAFVLHPMRDRLPTLPQDLSEYARLACGPRSWTAEPDIGELPEDSFDDIEAGPLLGVRPSDIPRLAASVDDEETKLEHREKFILGLLDGSTNVEQVLDIAGLPFAEALAILCDLCARGIVKMDAPPRLEQLVELPAEDLTEIDADWP